MKPNNIKNCRILSNNTEDYPIMSQPTQGGLYNVPFKYHQLYMKETFCCKVNGKDSLNKCEIPYLPLFFLPLFNTVPLNPSPNSTGFENFSGLSLI